MRGEEAIVEVLASEGVDRTFGLIAEDTMGLLAALGEYPQDPIQFVHARHEQGAMAMADGYARAGNGIGVCIVGRGPGIAQTGTSLVTAAKCGSQLLAIVPEPLQSATYDLKAFPQGDYLRATVGEVVEIRDSAVLFDRFRDTFRRLRAGDGPIAVQIAWDVLVDEDDSLAAEAYSPAGEPIGDGRKVRPTSLAIDRIATPYVEGEFDEPPVVIAGKGAADAGAKPDIECFAEQTGSLLGTTLQAKGLFADHPYNLGVLGGYGSEFGIEQVRRAPVVCAIGCSLNPYTTNSGGLFGPDTTLIHIDADPASIGRHTEVDIGVVGDAATTMARLTERLEGETNHLRSFWTEEQKSRIGEAPAFAQTEFPNEYDRLDPREIVPRLDEVLPDDRVLVVDGGHFSGWVVDGLSVPSPKAFVWTLDFLSMGLGIPVGVGAALSVPESCCVTVCGDVGFMMSLPEVETAVRNDVSMAIVVINDAAAGVEYQQLRAQGLPASVAQIKTPNIASVAEALGATGLTIDEMEALDEVRSVLDEPLAGPVVLDCQVNSAVRHRALDYLKGSK